MVDRPDLGVRRRLCGVRRVGGVLAEQAWVGRLGWLSLVIWFQMSREQLKSNVPSCWPADRVFTTRHSPKTAMLAAAVLTMVPQVGVSVGTLPGATAISLSVVLG